MYPAIATPPQGYSLPLQLLCEAWHMPLKLIKSIMSSSGVHAGRTDTRTLLQGYLSSLGPKAEGDINLQRNPRNYLVPKPLCISVDQSLSNVVLQSFPGNIKVQKVHPACLVFLNNPWALLMVPIGFEMLATYSSCGMHDCIIYSVFLTILLFLISLLYLGILFRHYYPALRIWHSIPSLCINSFPLRASIA
jgi:hypothetical protein